MIFWAALAQLACTPKPPKADAGEPMMLADGGTPVTRAAMVSAAADCALEGAQAFVTAAGAMKVALDAHAAAPDATTLAAAREAFHTAFDVWQDNEGLQFGPSGTSMAPGGQDLREQINAWPLFNRCGVEERLVSKAYETNVPNFLVNVRGMMTIEFLLFYEGADTVCTSASPIVSGGTWAALTPAERAARKAAYAAAVAGSVKTWADELVSQWQNGFREKLTTPGASNELFKSTQASLNVVSDAVFHVDKMVKDTKLGIPLGITGDCFAPPCLDRVESQYAGRSKRNLVHNLIGLRKLTRGCGADFSGAGFDDLLLAVGADAAAQALVDKSDGIQTALDAVEEADLRAAITSDDPSVRAVHTATKVLTDFLKTDYLTLLDLELPKALEGDND
ncbi:MAG: imelysin family protein [Myxococcaceae bacterium]|nr:imelysin family protein [Myxococcaceae bacterium]